MCPRIAVDGSSTSAVQQQFVQNLARHMTELDFRRLSEVSFHGSSPVYIPPDLATCTHVWVRIDRVRHALEAPYNGPFRVVRRCTNVFLLELPSGATDTVSISRLKPAYLPITAPT